ncbi:MAG: zinc-dependent alcohol dehydrogenase [Planctomycetota bacterium]|jgi:(R,R)-butanediol dehydrogenase/meso-butanediol dehydrogenase/diacetyl reductase
MKAAVVKGKRLIAYEEVPTPSVQPGTLLLKTRYCSICGTDLEYVEGQMHGNPLKAGAILGHEFAAEVAAIGEGVDGWSVGDRVTTGDLLLPCGQCYYCRRQLHHLCQGKDTSPRTLPIIISDYAARQGAMAEYFVKPPSVVQRIPDNVSDEEAALVEPLRTGVSAVKTTGLKFGESAVVFGAGKIGLGTMLCARAAGVSPVIVIDPIRSRLDKALEMGADAVFSPDEDVISEVVKLTEAGPDAVIICVRSGDVLNQAVEMVRRAGIIGLAGYGLPTEIDPMVWWKKQVRFTAVAGGFGGPSGLIYTSMRLIAGGQVNVRPIISEIIPLKEAQRAFDSMYSGENIAPLLKP